MRVPPVVAVVADSPLHSALVAHGVTVLPVRPGTPLQGSFAQDARLLWCGPALSQADYEAMHLEAAAIGLGMEIPPPDYTRAQLITGWLPTLNDVGPETRLVPASHLAALPRVAEQLAWPDCLVRNYQGGLGHRPLAEALADPLALGGGCAVVKNEHWLPETRCRFFVWHQNVWPHPNAPEEAVFLAGMVTRRFWHLFYSVDVAQTPAGRWRVLDVNDGQASPLAEWPLAHWANCLALSIDPTKPV